MEKRKDNKETKKTKFFSKHKKITISLIVCAVILCSFLTINYGRYAKNIIHMYYLRSKNFYFSSDKLTLDGKEYEINPWGGTTVRAININMSSYLNHRNEYKATESDIDYTVSCEASPEIDCYFETEGETTVHDVIRNDTHVDSFNVNVKAKPTSNLKNGDRVSVRVVAKSVSPYVAELSATFVLIIGDYGLNYEIEDTKGNNYFDCIVTNTLETESRRITFTITDTSKVAIDMSDKVFSLPTATMTVDGNNYIKTVSFILGPKSSYKVRFFKKITTDDYSYPNGPLGTPIVTFTNAHV